MDLRPYSSWNAFNLGRWLVWLVALVLWTAALLSTQPVHASRAVIPPEAQFPLSKLLHIGGYAGLTVLTVGLPAWRGVRPWLLLLLVLHGPATEFLQNFVPPRSGSLADVAIDEIGVGLGLLFTWRWWLGEFPGSNEGPSLLKHPAYDTPASDRQWSA